MKFAYFRNNINEYDFIYNSLKRLAENDCFSEIEQISKEYIEKYDGIIVKDNMTIAKQILSYGHKNVIVIPNFNDVENCDFLSFISNNNVKILCLSHKIYNKLINYNKKCFYIQCFNNPDEKLNQNAQIKGGLLIENYNIVNKGTYEYLLRNCSFIKSITVNIKNSVSNISELRKAELLGIKSLNLVEYDLEDSYFKTLLQENDIYIPGENNLDFQFEFLEAMNMGVCVVAPNKNLYNEYISNGTNGYLFEENNYYPLEFSNLKEIKKRTYESVYDGYDRWRRNSKNLTEFLSASTDYAKKYSLYYMWENAEKFLENKRDSKITMPKVSIVTVCRNAEKEIEETIKSCINQDYGNLEYVILDGLSNDGTIEIIKKYEARIDYWHSKADGGIYPAMIDSLEHTTGEFVIFMNAGDKFVSNDALSRMFKRMPANIDIAFGHHIYTTEEEGDRFHSANDFNSTWYRLKNGYLDFDWLGGMPCHQTVATRITVLKALKFNPNYKIAADHELYFRAKDAGYEFYNSNELISIYLGGGISANREELCVQEWQNMAGVYGIKEAADYFYNNFPGRNKKQQNIKLWFSIKKRLKHVKLIKLLKEKLDNVHKNKVEENVYWGKMEDGFKLFKKGIPSFIEEIQGLGSSEKWGRWTVEKKVIIKFKEPLPNKFKFIISGYAFGKNVGKEVMIKIGECTQAIIMESELGKSYGTIMENNFNSKTIEIIIPNPNSPYELYGSQCNDKRKLGLGISEINIRECK
ncbi:DUF7024 domain-containing protein [Clostridium beijerinckii]|uniref:Putative glycosyltransferase EpsE n=1 Tax=Clostridium beijerinckii TaxID=1520 RepID=A0A1S8SAR0_CLOBE|nr:glycosyltransferase family 2 protein [Clostridium beijerinckii]NRY60531.1 glycosyltransferase involved in cell wall biosynthesis [Clostridium beijerinckii]OOM62598.1 putative glycosyltransferase EpsE [Clostridium beijerinckii]